MGGREAASVGHPPGRAAGCSRYLRKASLSALSVPPSLLRSQANLQLVVNIAKEYTEQLTAAKVRDRIRLQRTPAVCPASPAPRPW